jgi:hypothetical protein
MLLLWSLSTLSAVYLISFNIEKKQVHIHGQRPKSFSYGKRLSKIIENLDRIAFIIEISDFLIFTILLLIQLTLSNSSIFPVLAT